MSISLFEHNEKAYLSAVSMLAETGKAAVIHPTGTGKSFIGFKLCEDNPDKTVCWLSPSSYIFKTQLENLEKTGADIPQNIKFFTYAKLSQMTDEEIAEIKADISIYDEYHRAGAEHWQTGVERLSKTYPDIPVLGLSATNIRYLDNQRDMADELFDGNIASEMTLGEAIVRGILKAPLYISTVFSYRKELERYARRLNQPRNISIKKKAEKYLEELRRAIEKSDGLETVFEKYMPNMRGKYVAFCSNKEHLDEMILNAPHWFEKIDKDLKIYRVYSDNTEASAEFADFKADKSNRLRVLFCIDMLNEGVHLDDIDGVILFRPTVSPTVYKQQIGRALTAGKSGTPVIFDVINNFENLYSMGSIEQEMANAINYYNSLGEGDKIIVDKFEIIGVVKECVELFDRLNEAFTATWEEMYSHAESYYKKNGDLDVPRRYKTENGLSLGNWIDTQRGVRAGKTNGILTEEKIALLDKIGMRWESISDLNFERNYAEAVKYSEEYGELLPPSTYVADSGIRLGAWVANLRTYRKSGLQRSYLTEKRIEMLDRIGMVWNVPDYLFEKNYAEALVFYRENGHLDIPADYVSNGVKIGRWIRNVRNAYNNPNSSYRNLEEEQISRLEAIGMKWSDVFTRAWENGFEHAKSYYERYFSVTKKIAVWWLFFSVATMMVSLLVYNLIIIPIMRMFSVTYYSYTSFKIGGLAIAVLLALICVIAFVNFDIFKNDVNNLYMWSFLLVIIIEMISVSNGVFARNLKYFYPFVFLLIPHLITKSKDKKNKVFLNIMVISFSFVFLYMTLKKEYTIVPYILYNK